jgi:electron transport complex protein RnfG
VSGQAEAGPFRLVATLTVAGLLSGVAIVGTWQITRPAILAHQAAALRAAVFEVVPGSTGLQRLEWRDGALVAAEGTGDDEEVEVVYGAYGEDGALLGYALPAAGAGFQDTISMLLGYDADGRKIVGMRVLESRETPGLGDKIVKDDRFVHAFDALPIDPALAVVGKGKKSAPYEVEAITGATISSKAVVRIASRSTEQWADRLPVAAAAPAMLEVAP